MLPLKMGRGSPQAASKSLEIFDDTDANHDPEGEFMEFRLTYEGLLLGSAKDDSRADHKHEIRKAFHPQLKRLWELTPFLSEMRQPLFNGPILVNAPRSVPRVEHLAANFTAGAFHFVPLVTEDLSLLCGLDIMFLRPGRPGVMESGDIDNRLKTLLDALRCPKKGNELGGHETPDEGENPFYCLLEDDKLVSRLSVNTDTLLEPTGKSAKHPGNDARIVITVNIRPYSWSWGNMPFS
jgi:hypothetical protein